MRKCEKGVTEGGFKAPAYANLLRQGYGGQEATQVKRLRRASNRAGSGRAVNALGIPWLADFLFQASLRQKYCLV